jgi:hypothetical protein
MIMRIVAVDVLRELLMLGVRGRVKRRRLVVQRRIAAATVELVAGDREKISPSEKFMQAPEKGEEGARYLGWSPRRDRSATRPDRCAVNRPGRDHVGDDPPSL